MDPQLEFDNIYTGKISKLPTRFLPEKSLSLANASWPLSVSDLVVPPAGRDYWILRFQETGMMREKDRLTVEIKIRKSADFSQIQPFDMALLGITWPHRKLTDESEHIIKTLNLEVSPLIKQVLAAIYMEAQSYLTINKQRMEYTRAAWAKAAKVMKKGLSGKVSIPRLLDLQQVAINEHLANLAAYEASREKTNQAPVSREIANTSRLYQAAERGLSIELDGLKISAKEDWGKIQTALKKAQEDGTADQVFAAAALQSDKYNGLEILALVCLIQIVREKAGLEKTNGPIQKKLESFVIDPTELLLRLGLISPSTSRTQKARQKKRLAEALLSLARKLIKTAPAKKDAATRITINGTRSGFFVFAVLEARDGEHEAGSWKFSDLSLLQILTDDNMPFRPIPTDPFIYIAENADPRFMDDIMKAAWDVVLAASFASHTKQKIPLDRFNLTSGEGIPAELAQTKQKILVHALERYAGGAALINHGILEYTPPIADQPIPATVQDGIKKIVETTARRTVRGELRRAAGKRPT